MNNHRIPTDTLLPPPGAHPVIHFSTAHGLTVRRFNSGVSICICPRESGAVYWTLSFSLPPYLHEFGPLEDSHNTGGTPRTLSNGYAHLGSKGTAYSLRVLPRSVRFIWPNDFIRDISILVSLPPTTTQKPFRCRLDWESSALGILLLSKGLER